MSIIHDTIKEKKRIERKAGITMKDFLFEYYVLNYNPNEHKVENFNIFRNIHVQEQTEKAVKKYLRSPKKFKYEFLNKKQPPIYGFDAFVKELESIIRWQEWSRCEYEIAVGSLFTTEIKDVLREVKNGNLASEDVYDELKKIDEHSHELEKWDCYMQAKPNMEMIAREVIWQYKQHIKNNKKL